jgi:hypothetical protein
MGTSGSRFPDGLYPLPLNGAYATVKQGTLGMSAWRYDDRA